MTPPSSDSGVHSLGEQWENMSTNSMDMESEQNEKPSYGGDTRRLVSGTSRPPNTEEGNRFDCPWTDCVSGRKSDDISSVVIRRDDREVEFNKLTIYESEHSMVYSGTEERWHYYTDRRRNDDEDTSSQSESTGLTECGISICDDSDDDFFRNKEWPIPEHTVIPRKAADNVNRTVRNRNNNRGRCSGPGSEYDTTSDENSSQIDRPFTKLTTAGAGIKIDSLGVDYAKCGEIPVTKLIPAGVLDTDEHLVMRVSTITAELSGVETSSYSETDINDSPVVQEYVYPERRRRDESLE